MGNRWAVLIGVNDYHESLGPLRFCTNDAKLMHETLASECCAFPSDNIVLLTDDQPKDCQPTFGNIHSWLGTWLSRPGPDDLVLVYFAGHGREANGQALLAPLDATLDSLPVTGIPIQYVRDMLDRCKASQKVLILDACHSGSGRDVATMTTGFREALDAGKGLYTIASCDSDQISYEWPEKQHGVFTHYLVEALRHGAPVEPDGRVLLDRVYDWARNGILAWTADKRLKQEPIRICRIKGDIHIASRSLSVEQQLKAAQAQLDTQQDTITKLRTESERLSKDNEKLQKRLKSCTQGNNKPESNSRTAKRNAAIGVLYPAAIIGAILGVIGFGVSAMAILGLGCVLVGATAWLCVYRYRVGDTESVAAGAWLLTFVLGLVCISLLVNPPGFVVDLPWIGRLMKSSYFSRYQAAITLKSQGDLQSALHETVSLEESLRNKASKDLVELHGKVAALKQEIVTEYGPVKKVWPEEGRVMVWSDSLQSPIAVASFESIDKWLPSPDGQMIVLSVNGGKQVFAIEVGEVGLTALVPIASSREYYPLAGWKDSSTIMIGSKDFKIIKEASPKPVASDSMTEPVRTGAGE